MVGALLILLFLAAFQVGFALFVRNTLISDATEGARFGARADATADAGASRTRDLITRGLAGRFARDVHAEVVNEGGARVVRVTVVAPLPIVGPFGPAQTLTVSGRAYQEGQ
ncbi:hypothetical protein ATK17_0479 [Branchiibius hedensis]|uniref:TadE-like domain-containing protein n=2 Tax=Branchiibius hedensis TaxID=672460 RepID=A0A2Y8ZPB2_9MICO|nr:hypothetical protein ATK17_0479 [Branchiibius hedensis]SSA33206.1 hypothetical protein SAMN04489750_0479 [Branchiibius hedensis]